MMDEDGSTAETAPGTRSSPDKTEEFEALACVACRSRKLKCNRAKPACSRCLKLKVDCAYPESRRKPASKRRNVVELEERLAQVEVLLRKSTEKNASTSPITTEVGPQEDTSGQNVNASGRTVHNGSDHNPGVATFSSLGNDASGSLNWDFEASGNDQTPLQSGVPFEMPDMEYQSRNETAGATSYELLGLGLFEALPPTEMIEELHQAYFTNQHPVIPLLHPGRYMQAFYSAPHLRPPMALQYAVWTMATLGIDKYSHYHHAFHRRCRHYLEEDELKGDGEHFLTVAHAQAWALIATAEARNMWFTRAAMSTARCIKLLHMMGLHRLDDPNAEFEMMPTILPPKDWVELEERRRVFWAAFASDSHAAIATGWPTLIDADEVTTHLPSSEEAFNHGREETTCRLHEVFTGATYSSFAATAVICHVFKLIMKHSNRSQPDDCPGDFQYGKYWNRHRELDNILSGAFMFLPARFRLPQNLRDATAVHTNLNLHAAIICLHNSAYEMATEHKLSKEVKKTIRDRLMCASNEIVNIVKLTSHSNHGFKSPFVALSLYVALSFYTAQAQEEGLTPVYVANIEFLFTAMEAIGKQHRITLNFLRQAIIALQEAGIDYAIRVPKVPPPSTGLDTSYRCSQIPLFARSRVSKRTAGILPPLPGRLPLSKPVGRRTYQDPSLTSGEVMCVNPNPLFPAGSQRPARGLGPNDQEQRNANKRRRVNLSPEPSSTLRSNVEILPWCPNGPVEEILSSADSTPGDSSLPSVAPKNPETSMNLPHRGGGDSSTSGSSPSATMSCSSTATPQSGTTSSEHLVRSGAVFGTTASAAAVATAPMVAGAHHSSAAGLDMGMFDDLNGWDTSQDAGAQYTEVTAAMLNDDSWMILNDVGGNGSHWATGAEGPGAEGPGVG